ncbi:MAG: TlpA family protein disulfide reductase [Phycisphaerales bacterium JB064]
MSIGMPTRLPVRAIAAASLVAIAAGLAACASTGSTNLSRSDQRQLEAAADGAEVVAVMMTAEWCGICKTLEPRFNEAMTTLPYNSMRVIYADYTDRSGDAAKATLKEAGLTSLAETNGRTTGVVYLIDADTGELLGDIRGTSVTSAQIRQKLQEAIDAAS